MESGSRSGMLGRAMRMIGDEGRGLVVVINRHTRHVLSQALQMREGKAARTDIEELRDYGIGAQILTDLNVHDMILLTNSHQQPVGLKGYNLNIVAERPIA